MLTSRDTMLKLATAILLVAMGGTLAACLADGGGMSGGPNDLGPEPNLNPQPLPPVDSPAEAQKTGTSMTDPSASVPPPGAGQGGAGSSGVNDGTDATAPDAGAGSSSGGSSAQPPKLSGCKLPGLC